MNVAIIDISLSHARNIGTVCGYAAADAGAAITIHIILRGGSASDLLESDVDAIPSSYAEAWTLAAAGDYDVVFNATSTGGYVAYQTEIRACIDAGVWPVVAHGSNDPIELSSPDRVQNQITVGGGDDIQGNRTSYGPGLELYAQNIYFDNDEVGRCGVDYSQSCTVAVVAGWCAGLKNAGWSFWDARAALRDNTGQGWTEEDGFGRTLNPLGVIAKEDLLLHAPVNIQLTDNGNGTVTVTWTNFAQTRFAQTVIVHDGRDVYSGTDETALIAATLASGDFEFYTEDSLGNRSVVYTTLNTRTYAESAYTMPAVNLSVARSATARLATITNAPDVSQALLVTWSVASFGGAWVDEAEGEDLSYSYVVPETDHVKIRAKWRISGIPSSDWTFIFDAGTDVVSDTFTGSLITA